MNQRMRRIVDYIQQNGPTTASMISGALGIPQPSVRRSLFELRHYVGDDSVVTTPTRRYKMRSAPSTVDGAPVTQ